MNAIRNSCSFILALRHDQIDLPTSDLWLENLVLTYRLTSEMIDPRDSRDSREIAAWERAIVLTMIGMEKTVRLFHYFISSVDIDSAESN